MTMRAFSALRDRLLKRNSRSFRNKNTTPFQVKVQRSIFPRDESLLIYNRSGSVFVQADMTASALAQFGDRLKFYAMARMNGTEIVVLHEIEDQSW